MTKKIIIHVITGLNNGGAEGVLFRLCKNDTKYKHVVISLMGEGKYGPMLQKLGIEILCLNMPQGKITAVALYKLFRIIRFYKPALVQTWMYHADLIGGVISKLAGVKSVFWNIRSSDLDEKFTKKTTWLIAKTCAFLSYIIPEKTLCCAHRAKDFHVELGYKKDITVIGNGYDFKSFVSPINCDNVFRSSIGVNKNDLLIGMVARYDPQKDHINFFKALKILKERGYVFKAILVGKDINNLNNCLIESITELNLKDQVFLLDQRTDVHNIMQSLDIHVLSSAYGEAFPNVVAESMFCGTPNVVTNVGDAAYIVGDCGKVVESSSSLSLANAISEYVDLINKKPEEWELLCRKNYERARNNFDIYSMIESYHRVWEL